VTTVEPLRVETQLTRGNEMFAALNDPKTDDKIRAALRDADRKGKLGVVAAVVGIAGGTSELRRIMDSTDELSVMDRGMLSLHLGTY
jgi:hypothetical protein